MITLEQYYRRLERLEAPSNLTNATDIVKWWEDQMAELRSELSEKDLAELDRRLKEWQKKVDSSLN